MKIRQRTFCVNICGTEILSFFLQPALFKWSETIGLLDVLFLGDAVTTNASVIFNFRDNFFILFRNRLTTTGNLFCIEPNHNKIAKTIFGHFLPIMHLDSEQRNYLWP